MLKNNLYRYIGAVHIHSVFSDGTGDLKTIVSAAKKAGLDFIIVTDHNYYDAEEGIIDGIYLIKGEEISPVASNHYLALGIKEEIVPDDNPEININNVRAQGGFGFAAHPDEGINNNGEKRKNSHNCIPWTDKNVLPDGIEIWNWFSNWADNLDDRNLFKLAYSYLFKDKICTSPSKLTLNWWDELNANSEKVVPAIGGVDAHALKFYKYIIPVTVFPYETCFRRIANVIYLKEELSNNFMEAKSQILNALKAGNNTILNRYIYNKIPNIYAKDLDDVYSCGDEIQFNKNLCIEISSEEVLELMLVYNGVEVETFKGKNFVIPMEKIGKYRIEASYKGKKFLYTNYFCVKGYME